MSGVCDTCGGCESDPCSMSIHEEAAAEAEREQVLSWLRGAADVIDATIGVRGSEGATVMRAAADAIERCDHHKPEEPT